MPVGTQNSVIQGCGLHHVAIQTRDWEQSMKLYRDILGMQQVASFGTPERQIVLLDMGDGSYMELFAPTETSPAPAAPAPNDPVPHIALATTDTRSALEHVRQAGYEITIEPKDLQLDQLFVTIAFFKGPNGEIIEFFQTH